MAHVVINFHMFFPNCNHFQQDSTDRAGRMRAEDARWDDPR